MPSLEQSLLDMNKVVEKCSKEVERESLKKDTLIKENSELRDKIQEFQHIYQEL